MPVWSLIVNSILWAISICLAGFSIRFIIKGVRDLMRAKHSEYADLYEDRLDENKNMAEGYKEIIDGYQKMISEFEKLLDTDVEKIHSSLLGHLEDYYTRLEDVMKKYEEILKQQIDIHKRIQQLTKGGGYKWFLYDRSDISNKEYCTGSSIYGF